MISGRQKQEETLDPGQADSSTPSLQVCCGQTSVLCTRGPGSWRPGCWSTTWRSGAEAVSLAHGSTQKLTMGKRPAAHATLTASPWIRENSRRKLGHPNEIHAKCPHESQAWDAQAHPYTAIFTSSITHKNLKGEATQPAEWKNTVGSTHSPSISLSLRKQGCSDTCYNKDESGRHYAKVK